MTKSLIIMDIDGTLTNSEKKITSKTKEALLATQEQGARLILASWSSCKWYAGFC
ncbi:haloacid dehalogenase-like hydrolase [Streptococcus gallolyticus]|uniref:Haloacid dehalogenase-like hydrolase n=1 Tax=Streptococcus gallolyticus TaxID=315405 RepID=A0A380K4X9_9STRE|nr:haloacid dehalogenase-like hydrolase [Streptococcus gallolyticus]